MTLYLPRGASRAGTTWRDPCGPTREATAATGLRAGSQKKDPTKAPRPDPGVAAPPAAPQSRGRAREGPAEPGALIPGVARTVGVLSAALLYLTSPLTWSALQVPLWSPAVGLGLVLVAWFGWRLALAPLAGCAAL